MEKFILAIDQGTTSTRCVLFDASGQIRHLTQTEHTQFFPAPGWVEHDAEEILNNTLALIDQLFRNASINRHSVAAVGITNQRETTVIWDRKTGIPIHRAIVWQDTRTDSICQALSAHEGQNRFRSKTGLPITTYFSGPKIRWLLDHVPNARERAQKGELLFGTIDSWLIWNLTGGQHVTDPSNASRTLLMDLRHLCWDSELLDALEIPKTLLPEIRSSSEIYGSGQGILEGIPIAGDLGDQQAALFGQACFTQGEAKNTYGTGCFLLMNTGHQIRSSAHGLLTTVAYQLGTQSPVYALEGSVAVTGSLIQWLRDNLGMIQTAAEVESLAQTVEDAGGIYIVPAFSGLFAPYWRGDARGVIVGLTRYVNKGHFARAALEATAYQTREILDAMKTDLGHALTRLQVDGGMVVNDTLMQFQSDLLGVPVIRPKVVETTALGAAYAAGLAVGFWQGPDELKALWQEDQRFDPKMNDTQREEMHKGWLRAVERSFDWA
ncbi:MAG: glycerol kinase [Pseudomonadota bacterium]|jgi:glycerol kinase